MASDEPSAGIDFNEVTQEEWDAARRLRDAVNLHVAVARETREQRSTPPFVAIDLADGTSDGVLYDSRRDAVRHQKSDYRFYVKVGPKGMGEREALVVLMYARRAYKAGVVFAEEEPIMPHRLEVAAPFIPRTLRGLKGVMRRD
jgi:hypothetical protein